MPQTNTENHYICTVTDINGTTVYSQYFDGTQAQAIAHFRKCPKLRKHMQNWHGKRCEIQANPIQVFSDYKGELDIGQSFGGNRGM